MERAIRRDWRSAEVPDRLRAILEYAQKLGATPWEMNEGDLAPLRVVGLDDRAIHDVASVVAYFSYVNRIADGLGVELEDESR